MLDNSVPLILFKGFGIVFRYLIFSKNLLRKTDRVAAFSTDYSPITFYLCHLKDL